jgi:hypothetical protein
MEFKRGCVLFCVDVELECVWYSSSILLWQSFIDHATVYELAVCLKEAAALKSLAKSPASACWDALHMS